MSSGKTDSRQRLAFTNAQLRRTEVTLASYSGIEAPCRIALTDEDPTVRAAGLSALDRLGTLSAEEILQGLQDPDLRVRRRSCELAIAIPVADWQNPDAIDCILLNHLRTGDETMAELSAWTLGERHQQLGLVNDHSNHSEADSNRNSNRNSNNNNTGSFEPTDGTDPTETDPPLQAQHRADEPTEITRALIQTVHEHPDALVREAAVAALGCIGHIAGKAAILHAIGDKATVRRRAVIALAAFEGADVEEALAKATGDRDWQVRQAAEDLLA